MHCTHRHRGTTAFAQPAAPGLQRGLRGGCVASPARPPRAVLRAGGRRRVAACTAAPTRVFEHVDWGAVEGMCERLAAAVGGGGAGSRYDVILAVTRGGMVPATLLAQALEVRNVLTATVIFYTDEGDTFYGMAEPRFLAFPNPERLEGRRVLVVDDVWDSGRTAIAVRRRVEGAGARECDVCVLHFKEKQTLFGEVRPQFFAAETDDWIVYPWERISPSHKARLASAGVFQD